MSFRGVLCSLLFYVLSTSRRVCWSQVVVVDGEQQATWTSQSALLPEFEWAVVDHADGNSFGYGMVVAGEAVFVCGSMTRVVRVENAATGAFVESENLGDDGDIYVAKVSTAGEPQSLWLFGGGGRDLPSHLAKTHDEKALVMTGRFQGNMSFGAAFDFENKKDTYDGFVLKISVDDGAVLWARQVEAAGGVDPAGVACDEDGNVAFVGKRCLEEGGLACEGFLTVLDGEDASTLFDVSFGPAVPNLEEVVFSSSSGLKRFYATGSLQGAADFGKDIGTLTSASDDDSDALLFAVSARTGARVWAAKVSGLSNGASSGRALAAADGAVYMACRGTCVAATSTGQKNPQEVLYTEGLLGGAVVKADERSGNVEWAADVAGSLGMAVFDKGVYLTAHHRETLTFGDAVFTSWGALDQLVMKLDAQTGEGQWVLQTGGDGMEHVRALATDAKGDLYSIGFTRSNPAYFGSNLAVSTHNDTDGYDFFLTKLRTSKDTLPSCKTNDTTLLSDACFVQNMCFKADDASLQIGQHCRTCDPESSQSAFEGLDLSASCFIDDVCTHDGAFRTIWTSPFSSRPSTCQRCDLAASPDSWTIVDDFFVSKADNVTCVFAPFGLLAGYGLSSSKDALETTSKIDLDAAEIFDFAAAADWDRALFVYTNGGGGLCSSQDVLTTDATDSCFAKNTTDAKGNSVTAAGAVQTIYGFATNGRENMANETFWNLYRDFYDDDKYADTFMQNALNNETGTWASRSTAFRAELATKSAAYLAVYMQVIHKMEDAVVKCAQQQIPNATAAWDEAWALYAGSLEGDDGSGKGYLLYDLADEACAQFATCSSGTTTAAANANALAIANSGLESIGAADCDAAADDIQNFVAQMNVAALQGLVRSLYLADPAAQSCNTSVCDYDDQTWASGWAFAAALLPQINQCNSTVADLLIDNLDVDGPGGAPLPDGYEYVKRQVESTYPCLKVDCADVGAYNGPDGILILGMEAC